ncbi:DNA polymerase III epsilon subunit-like 3'-5' exonuclease [Opitutaceae bacterium TAV1]|nr:DNA polymerase III epsilon subunit-like 3'-5' exonuclease [Opitutaceae bacterium TAV1]
MSDEMKDVMLDLETWDNRPGGVILSIGAVWFGGGRLGQSFYTRIDPQSSVAAGLSMGVDTVQWWMNQPEAARLEVLGPGVPLDVALGAFAVFLGVNGRKDDCNRDVRVWGNGADFDNAMLAEAFRVMRHPIPWAFWNSRCYRTAIEGAPHDDAAGTVAGVPHRGTHHNALDDAETQALRLMAWQAVPAASPADRDKGEFGCMCAKLQACVQRHGLGVEGERLDDIVCREIDRLKATGGRVA